MDQAVLVMGLSRRKIAELIAESERLGLLAMRQERGQPGHTYHPLVRQFLEARLARELGDGFVANCIASLPVGQNRVTGARPVSTSPPPATQRAPSSDEFIHREHRRRRRVRARE